MNDELEKKEEATQNTEAENGTNDSAKTESNAANGQDVKKEAADTLNQAKDVIKNINIKEDAAHAKGIFADMLKSPLGKMGAIADDSTGYLKFAVLIVLVWTAAVFIRAMIYIIDYSFVTFSFRSVFNIIIMPMIAPAIQVCVMSAAVFFLYRKEVKQITPAIVVVAIAYAPVAASAVLSILTTLISRAYTIIGPINSFLSMTTIILLFFGIKALVKDDDNEAFFKKFLLIYAVYLVARFVLSFLSIPI